MDPRNNIEDLNSLADNFSFLIAQMQLRKREREIEIKNEHELCLNYLEYLQKCVIDDYNQAITNNDIDMKNYIIQFSKKLADLKKMTEHPYDHNKLDAAIEDVIIAAIPPIDKNETTRSKKTFSVGMSILGALLGVTFGMLMLAAIAIIPFTLPAVLIAAAVGAVIGVLLGAKFGWEAGSNEYRFSKTAEAMKPLSQRMHQLFPYFPVKPESSEEKNNPPMIDTNTSQPPFLKPA